MTGTTQCIFCKIVNKELPAAILYEDEEILAFKDVAPRAPHHILLIPKKHLPDLASVTEADIPMLGKLNYLAAQIAARLGIDQSGYRLITNCREDGGQEVPHLHFHLLGGVFLGAFVTK
ncbi:MAG: histidine triad nucleotide-binding protein [Clostridiales bacterium]|jgi:histidine triad (HIT) family protein|nr:histidine triad nucleotide-binding protein [Clostridiales bacterium]MDR2713585.1 histidine triad nucleotide-binding protein [Clostridiales bacterium]